LEDAAFAQGLVEEYHHAISEPKTQIHSDGNALKKFYLLTKRRNGWTPRNS
jgi:hypothetical protein